MITYPKAAAGSRAFTLIEILVVVAIVGVLSAVTVPAVTQARSRGQSAATQAEVASYQQASAVHLADTGEYPVPDPADIPDSCLEYDMAGGVPVNPRFCCVADQPCTYAGRQLAPLSRGAFAANVGGKPGVLRGALPRLPRLPTAPIAAASLQYQGVFHSCNDAACQRPDVTWTQPTECPSGSTRNGVTGLCQWEISRLPVNTAAQRELFCYNGVDDEEDGLIDCADDDCSSRSKCGDEDTDLRCADEFDNDADGNVDCADDDCAAAEACGACPEGATEDCISGEDDDCDGDIDCADSDCGGHYACAPACIPSSPNESDCSFMSGDEDCDGYQNCADSECVYLVECGGTEIGLCDNGIDDDMDGSPNCEDSDCASYYACGGTESSCDDSDDNDNDGFYDCADPDCDSFCGA